MAKVKIDDIYIGERRRREMGPEYVKYIHDLSADLGENGQITPITLRPPTEVEKEFVKEPYLLVAGGCRIAAAMLLGWNELEAFTREDPIDELKHRVLELHENMKRMNMSWADVAQAKAEMLAIRQEMAAAEGKTITNEEVAREIGDSPATFSRAIKVAAAIENNPELKGASSQKAAQRAHDMEQEMTRRMTSNEVRDLQVRESMGHIQQVVRTEDAGDFLRSIKTGTVDLVLTDPPYGIDYWKSGQKMVSKGPGSSLGLSQFDDSLQPTIDLLTDMVPQWSRVLRDTGWAVIFMSQDLYPVLEQLFKNCCRTHHDYRFEGQKACITGNETDTSETCKFLKPEEKRWIWYRPNSRNRPRFPDRHAMNVYEDILVVNMGAARLMKPGSHNLLIHDAEYGEDRIHANQKPFSLGVDLISRTTMIGDTVLDTCFGSGAFLAAAASFGRRPMGCDTNPDMRGPALGFIAKNFVPAPMRDMEAVHAADIARYGDEGVADFTEEEVTE